MVRHPASLALAAALALAACGKPSGPGKTGQAVAKGKDVLITTDEFKARLDEQSPFIRARYTALDRKKEFLDNLIRFEVLANEAERQGLAKDPEVQNTLKKVMVQKLVQKNFQDLEGAKNVPEEELKKFYDEHKDDYFRAKKVRLAAVVFNAPADAKDRAAKVAAAKKALAKIRADEQKNPMVFAQVVAASSEDPASKALAGDLGFKSQQELDATYGPAFAGAAFALQSGQVSNVVETPKGVYILKVTGQQDELNRPFDQVKAQIANRLYREKKSKEFDEWVKKLREDAKVVVDEQALESVQVSAAAAPGMPSGPHGGMPGAMPPGAPMGGPGGPRAAPAPAPTPAPTPAAAPVPAAAPAQR